MTRVTPFTRLHKFIEIVGDDAPAMVGHHYVIGDDLMAAMPRADVQRSIAAMIEAGIARLPFPELLVEFSTAPGVTRFLWLNETPSGFEAKIAMLTARGLVTIAVEPALVTIEREELRIENVADERDGNAIAIGSAFALLMLNIRGIDKQRIEPRDLNRARESLGLRESQLTYC